MHARRLRASLRGWGGVGAMAVVCALAVAFVLLLPHTQPRGDGSTGLGGPGVADGRQARAEACEDPQDQSLPPSNADGATIEAIKQRGYVAVGVDQNSYRWGYRDPNSTDETVELEGFDIDLARRIAQELLGDPDRIRFKAIPTNQRVPAIQSGQVDMVVRTMTITCTRLEDVAFSAPYFLTGQQVLAPNTSTITGYDKTLAGKRICSAVGSTAYDNLAADRKSGRLPASTDISTTVPNQLDCLVRLQLGEVDAVVTDGALAASQAAQDPTVELKGDRFTTEYYGVAMKKDADDLVRRVNRILADYRADGGWKASYDKWLSPTLGRDSESATPPTPRYR
ncbi:glutamate ABC transporter substrate-binding protein [Streptomyces chromofuscus]|uniref:Glutamate ABC transporter substrate-binding protein n=1 Tax=Streptomyces chromofuscus TaxID=42881 RepID=A0A7M2TDA1_STRCW|nr:glutamate ABC transporter substrate-binding protein [Streptomyces chromofuscus]QOV46717.1 glutamate ABC transporter substrate-binding protein [Streptomyces chromofuscus]GGT09067.1 sugar-binding protein [Streptomyces chromofuscus]